MTAYFCHAGVLHLQLDQIPFEKPRATVRLRGNVPPGSKKQQVGAYLSVLCESILITEGSGASVSSSAKWGSWHLPSRAEVRREEMTWART